MTDISTFYDIVITMDADGSFSPHFVAGYRQFSARIEIESGKILVGNLGKYSAEMVEEWRQSHVQELLENWQLAMFRKPLKLIAGLE